MKKKQIFLWTEGMKWQSQSSNTPLITKNCPLNCGRTLHKTAVCRTFRRAFLYHLHTDACCSPVGMLLRESLYPSPADTSDLLWKQLVTLPAMSLVSAATTSVLEAIWFGKQSQSSPKELVDLAQAAMRGDAILMELGKMSGQQLTLENNPAFTSAEKNFGCTASDPWSKSLAFAAVVNEEMHMRQVSHKPTRIDVQHEQQDWQAWVRYWHAAKRILYDFTSDNREIIQVLLRILERGWRLDPSYDRRDAATACFLAGEANLGVKMLKGEL
jgi:hypothetical protein